MISFKNIRQLSPMFIKLIWYARFIKNCADDEDINFSHKYRSLVFRKEIHRLNKSSFKLVLFAEGIEKSKGQVLFTPNHQSFSDIITMFLASDRAIGFVSKKEAKSLPTLIYNGIRSIGSTFIDRNDLRSEVLAFKEINNILEENKDLSYVVFPEGTRSKPPEFKLGEFHSGSFKIATKLGIPIVPVCIWGDKRVLDKNVHIRKYPIQVKFLDPIYAEKYDQISPVDLSNLIHEKMEKELSEMRKLDYKYIQVLNHYSNKRINKLKELEAKL